MSQRLSILKQPGHASLNNHLIAYPTPINLSLFWGLGALAGICLVLQLASGVFLSLHYTPNVDLAFTVLETLMRDLSGGWLLRYLHSNGASMFLVVVHLHLFRGMYHDSFSSPRQWVRGLGLVLLLVLMGTAFSGYVLPWGQMSFWGATVITSLASAFPLVGETIVSWLWGSFSVDNPTLTRFYSMHLFLPIILVGASGMHLAALHQYGSNNPLGVYSEMDKIGSFPYYYVKDLVGLVSGCIGLALLVFFYPTRLMHPDNYIPANRMATPTHIIPEWYFLPLHSLLRSFPSKAGGVAAIATVFFCLFSLSFGAKGVEGSSFSPSTRARWWLLFSSLFLLGWIGVQPVESPYVAIGQLTPLSFVAISITPTLSRLFRVVHFTSAAYGRHLYSAGPS